MPKKELDPNRVIFWRDVGKLTWAAIGRVMARELGRKVPFSCSATYNVYRRYKDNPNPRYVVNGEQATLLRSHGLTYRKIGVLLAESLGRDQPFSVPAVYEAVKRFKDRRAAQKSTEAPTSELADKPSSVRQSTAAPAAPAPTPQSATNTFRRDIPQASIHNPQPHSNS